MTKSFHNGLQGDPVEVDPRDFATYLATNRRNAERIVCMALLRCATGDGAREGCDSRPPAELASVTSMSPGTCPLCGMPLERMW